jgi:hypothetical protein
MKNYIENIELINKYLKKELSEKEISNFENLLKTDSNFNTLFEEHSTFLGGLKRQQLKAEIVKAKQTYIKVKWMKFLGISMVVLMVSALIYFNLKTDITPKPEALPNSNTTTKIVTDSVLPESVLKDKTAVKDTLKTEKIKIEEQTIASKIELANDITAEVEIPKKSAQTFTISSEKDTTIICKEGTKLIIKANSFTTTANREIAGNLVLNITEFYKLSDMLLANLTTTSNKNVLETGGMLHIEAKQNESILKLKESAHIELTFPSKVKKENMQLFSGEWKDGIINWTLEKQVIPIVKNEIVEVEEVMVEELEEDIEVPFAVVENAPIFPGCDKGDNNAKKACMSQKISEFVNRKFNTDLASELGLSGRQRINVIFKIDKSGKITGIRARAPHPGLEKEATRVIAMLPQMQPGKQRGRAVTVPYSLPIIFQVDKTSGMVLNNNNAIPIGTNPIRDSIVNMSFEDRLTSKDTADVSITEVENYILRTSKLGWINCDRFINNRNRIKYKLKIEEGKGVMRLKMVFKSMNSVLPSRRSGKEFDFKMVPKNEDVILIATKQDEGKLYFDILEAKTEENPNIEFNFKEVTVEELKRELEKLNKSL